MSTNVLARTDSRAALIWPEGIGQRLGYTNLGSDFEDRMVAARRGNATGTWRISGLDPRNPRLSHALFLVQKGSQISGADTDAKGRIFGGVTRVQDGRLILSGSILKEDGRKGSFRWALDHNGGTLVGAVSYAGGLSGPCMGAKQGDQIPADLGNFLAKRKWGASNRPGQGGTMGDLTYSTVKIGGVEVGKVPTGWEGKGPGNSEIKVDRKGVQVKPPDLNKIIEDNLPKVPGGGKKGGGGGGGEDEAAKVTKWVWIGAGVVAVLGLYAFLK